MDVGIVGGTGPLGRGLALRCSAAGLQVAVGSREPTRAAEVCAELQARWSTRAGGLQGVSNEQAAQAEVVVLATPWDSAVATAVPLADRLAGRTVVSVGNALIRLGREAHALTPPRGSVAALLQGALPEARVVAAGQHLPAAELQDLDRELACDVLVCGDDPAACQQTADLFQRIPGLRPLLAGSLAQAAAIEAFTAVLVTVNLGHKAHAAVVLSGVPGDGDGRPGAG